ncbi:GNAT family N-acetyltransferase [Natronosporangium hydrolyticum]|uniref:GNAT family N-acetyltransferase n=1 Tax=Natronosporangium hydrolyticum TaxID=2811111 RepID=A0A895YQN6_9ACTN|nr:GNAT family N-acetyltransferase [Natronosporangium hydrolyticum]QSB17066.1 GNAT family N-acetyltransferase [Natronosporangium hydrolyticum]
MVREWDPATAPEAEIDAVITALNDVLAADLPEDPLWQPGAMRAYLGETMPGERRLCWLTTADEPGSPPRALGHANLLLLGDIGVLEVLVHPSARTHGVGHALVAAAARRAYDEGLASIGVEAVGGTPAIKFWESIGFRCVYVELRGVLRLAEVDHAALATMARSVPDDYRIEFHPGGLPEALLEPYASAKASRQEGDELDLRPSSYDAQRLAESLTTLNRRGMRPYLVLALHEPSGEVAALTEVVIPSQHPARADQYDTIVVPDHRGLGLERAVKARMLQELSRAEPQLTEVQTWNAPENDPMSDVNSELGFQMDREWREYEVDVLDLIRQLSS